MDSLVTVGIPTYNRPLGLKNALDFFLNQSYLNMEIIVADNHSDIDPRDELPREFLSDSRVKIFRHDKNYGMAFNSEFIWRKAKGKYFVLGSDDDWWDPDFIKDLIILLENNPQASFAMSNFEEMDLKGNKLSHRSKFSFIKNIFGFGLPPYPNHLPLLSELSSEDIFNRICAFIDQNEYDGKANIHRALCRTDAFLNSVDRLYSLNLQGCWGFDQLLAFNLLVIGKLEVSPKILFRCTVGNDKNYVDERSRLEYLRGYYLITKKYLDVKMLNGIEKRINLKFLNSKIGFYNEFDFLLKKYIELIASLSHADLERKYFQLYEMIRLGEFLKVYDLIYLEISKLSLSAKKRNTSINRTLYRNIEKLLREIR